MPYLITFILLLPLFLNASPDPDFWWHLKSGQDLLLSEALPYEDPYSYGQTREWINHSWAHDLIVAYLFELGGENFLLSLRAMLLLVSGLFLCWLLMRRFKNLFALSTLLLVLFYYLGLGMDIRPQMWTHTFFVLLIYLVIQRGEGRKWASYFLPILFALWSNLHGGFVLGLVYLTLGVIFSSFTRENNIQKIFFSLSLVFLCALATLINPYGPDLHKYIFSESSGTHLYNADWQSVWVNYPFAFIAFTAIPLLLAVFAKKLPRLEEFASLLLLALLCHSHGRFLPLLAIFSILAIATLLAELDSRHDDALVFHFPRRSSVGLMFALLLCGLSIFRSFEQLSRGKISFLTKGIPLPHEASEILKHNEFGPNIATVIHWGGYLIHELHPRYLVSIDGRNITVFEPEYVEELLEAYHHGDGERYFSVARDSNLALFPSASPLCDFLAKNVQWTLIHKSSLSCLYSKKI